MLRSIGKVVSWLLLAVAAIGIVFVVGMRRKSPLVLNPVRRAGRASKPFVLKSSGTPGGIASVVRHVGRASGRAYETPVSAVPTDDGFVIARCRTGRTPTGSRTCSRVARQPSFTKATPTASTGRRPCLPPRWQASSRRTTSGPIASSASTSACGSGGRSRTAPPSAARGSPRAQVRALHTARSPRCAPAGDHATVESSRSRGTMPCTSRSGRFSRFNCWARRSSAGCCT